MYKKFEMELAGRTLRVDVGRVAKQANGAVLMHYGDTVVLSTATASDKPREGIDFFPLSVEYNEKLYAVGKIPGGFNKREGKASENAVLTCRVIDRPMRPLFPKDYRNDVTLENLVLSVEQDCSPELTAMLGSAIATAISDIPFDGPTASTQVGLVDGELVFNPTAEQKEKSDLALTVASTREKVIMIEAGANEVPEAKMLEAIFAAHEVNQKVIAFIDQIIAECGKPKHDYVSFAVPEELFEAIQKIVTPEEMEVAVFTDDKQTREENIRKITEKLEEGEICEGDPSLLRDFYRMGARMMTLTWNYPNQLGYPAKATGGEFAGKVFSEAGYGLTARGIEFLEEMENLGMIIDVAHLNDAGIRDVLKFTKKPFVASHSNARHLCSHPRNLNDELLKAIGERGGVIGLNYYAYFLRDWKDGETVVSRAEDIVAHAKYIRDMAGIEALGLGSDFDGMNGELEIASPADMTKLEDVFKKNGFTESEIEKIFCKNVMRIYRELLG